ncbi:MAG TPA: DUF4271 domain-containing protein [Segetibacter sp.]|nr:DUF4271 domain-containing protein [Segetibacter sp.]
MRKILLILLFGLSAYNSFAQTDTAKAQLQDTIQGITPPEIVPPKKRVVADTIKRRRQTSTVSPNINLPKNDSNSFPKADSSLKVQAADTGKIALKDVVLKKPFDSFYLKLLDNPFFKSKAKPIFLVVNERKKNSKDEMFYLLSGLLILMAFIKLGFSKYFKNLFRVFIQPSFRQKQTREQLQQGNFPSLLLNLFFVLSVAVYISFLLNYYHLVQESFWLLLLYSSSALIILYTGKYIFLSFAGWVFNVKEAINAYIFAIYLVNKIMGIVLIPFILIVAFANYDIKNVSITVSLLIILLLFLYRYFVSYGPVTREIKVSPLHFLFYILAFEITPLLLIYKTLMLYLNKSL